MRMYCLTCQYPLHSLESNRCPECGRSFACDDPRTFATSTTRPVIRWIERSIPLVFVGLGAFIGLEVIGRGTEYMGHHWSTTVGKMGLVVMSIGYAVYAWFCNQGVLVKHMKVVWVCFLLFLAVETVLIMITAVSQTPGH